MGLTSRAALLPTIVLVRGASGLAFMDRAVPGIHVPEATLARVARAPDEGEAAYELALEQARRALSLPGVRGLHIIDFRRDGAVSRLLRDLGIPTKEERRAHAHRAPVPV
jgi:methylenetetrahydrofolate reductase (NADPH)